MSRPDQSITFLRSFGYSIVRTPKPSIQPLQVFHRQGKNLDPLGHLLELVNPGSLPVPAVAAGSQPSISIEGKESSKVHVAIGITILGGIIRAFGGSDLGVNAAFDKAKTISFQYADVLEDSISRLQLEQFLNRAEIKPENSRGIIDKLMDDEIYVVTSTLKSKKFVVNSQGSSGADVAVNVPVIANAVGGSVAVKSENALSSKTSYEGPIPLVFGIQAVQLVFDDSMQFLSTEQLPPGDAAARAMAGGVQPMPGRAPHFLDAPAAMIRVLD
jgi:hypothetical protein